MNLVCSKCNQSLPVGKFNRAKDKKRGYSYSCKDCHNKYVREIWYAKNSDSQKAASIAWKARNKSTVLATKYKEDKEVIEKLLEIGCCEICGSIENLCVDHCHNTTKVRGLLCRDCNFGIGFLKDDVDRLQAAMVYLLRGREVG